jgi:hypothetical protein
LIILVFFLHMKLSFWILQNYRVPVVSCFTRLIQHLNVVSSGQHTNGGLGIFFVFFDDRLFVDQHQTAVLAKFREIELGREPPGSAFAAGFFDVIGDPVVSFDDIEDMPYISSISINLAPRGASPQASISMGLGGQKTKDSTGSPEGDRRVSAAVC